MIKSFIEKTGLFFCLIACSSAVAEEARFTLEEFGSGYIILNSQSDIVSTCSKIDAGFSCKFEGKGPLFLSNRVSELEGLVQRLESELSAAKSAVQVQETAELETVQEEKASDPTPSSPTPPAELENNNQLISPETRSQIISFSSTLFDRLFEFVDLVKGQTSS